jgi:large subunit ribosomal protein L24
VDREKSRVVVEGVNLRKRHRKPTAMDPEGGIISFEAPIHVSNVMLLDPATDEPTRIRSKTQRGREQGPHRGRERAGDSRGRSAEL